MTFNYCTLFPEKFTNNDNEHQ